MSNNLPRLDQAAVSEIVVALSEFVAAITASIALRSDLSSSSLYAEAMREACREMVENKTHSLANVLTKHLGTEAANGNQPI